MAGINTIKKYGRLRGTKVIVLRPEVKEYDSHGNPVYEYSREEVDDVLVNSPQTTANHYRTSVSADSGELFSDTKTLSLTFPKTWNKPLRMCKVIIPLHDPDIEWLVVGDPEPNLIHCPTRWNYIAKVSKSDG